MEDDPEDSLRAINARGRKKAVRRFLLSIPPMVAFGIVFPIGLWIGAGLWLSLGMAVVPAAGAAIALEKYLPRADDD